MLFTVSLQLTKTGHLSTSPSSISLACMLSGLCLLRSSPPLDWLLFTLSPLCCPFLPPQATPIIPFQQSLSLPLPFCLSQALSQFLMRYPSLTHSLSPKQFFFCSLPYISSLPLPAPSLFHILQPLPPPPILPPHRRPRSFPSYPSLTLSDSNWGSLIQTEVMMAIMYLAFQLRSLD